MSIINLSAINHFVLRKQHLTDDSKIDNIVQIVKDINGLHATAPKTPYLSLFARNRNFMKEQLDEELYIKRNLGKIRCMRKTVYILLKEMIPIAYSATKKMVELASEKYSQYLGVTRKQYYETSKSVLKILKGTGMTVKEIRRALKTELNISAIVNLMCDQGLLIRGNPRHGWKSNIHTYYLFEDYFPDIDLNAVDEARAKNLLVKRYLASFGPVTEKDVMWWPGFLKGEVKEILESLQDQVTQIEISDTKGSYSMLNSDLKSLQSLKIEKYVVNLLPSLDPYLMGYKDRERYLNPEYYNNVFDRSGNATSTILLNGKVIGVWDIAEKPEPLIKLFLFEEVERRVLKKVYLEGQKIGKFIADGDVQIKKRNSMVPLTRRTAGGVMSPLKDI